jgi:hypothetical protein
MSVNVPYLGDLVEVQPGPYWDLEQGIVSRVYRHVGGEVVEIKQGGEYPVRVRITTSGSGRRIIGLPFCRTRFLGRANA